MASSSSSGGHSDMQTDPRPRVQETAFSGSGGAGQQTGKGPASQFEIFDWYPRYLSCQKYFLDHSQHSVPVRALASFINILLPCQRQPNPVINSAGTSSSSSSSSSQAGSSRTHLFPPPSQSQGPSPMVSLIPYIRRLVATGMDHPGVLHGFFGDDWVSGIGSLHEQERRNYLFAAKSGGWASVKRDYDMLPLETVPFLRPLQGLTEVEVQAAERAWSDWLYHEDWMVGQRPDDEMAGESARQSRTGRS